MYDDDDIHFLYMELMEKINQSINQSIKPFMSPDVLRSTYFSFAHSILSYGIIFWGEFIL